jgi:hypothetical protein
MMLVDLPALAALCVSGCWELTDKSSKHLSFGTVAATLRRLHIGGCFRMTGATLSATVAPVIIPSLEGRSVRLRWGAVSSARPVAY